MSVTIPQRACRHRVRVMCRLNRENGKCTGPVGYNAPAIKGCRACTRYVGAMREELHHLAHLLPGAELRPALELTREPVLPCGRQVR